LKKEALFAEFEKRQLIHNRIHEQRKLFATEMLRAAVRRWVADRNPPPQYANTPTGRRAWHFGTRCALLLYTNQLVIKYKVSTHADVEVCVTLRRCAPDHSADARRLVQCAPLWLKERWVSVHGSPACPLYWLYCCAF
jgi:hypothetical protein